MKLEPMNKEELMASVSPTALSDHIYLVLCSCEYQRHKLTLLDAIRCELQLLPVWWCASAARGS
jgi:hypothetical protein